ncbi:MAG TPA: glucose-6-phosphate isomerase [Bacteroidales bacterium]|nr:glucose-6-phosphate isomerase [Bacteroidales bacterium]
METLKLELHGKLIDKSALEAMQPEITAVHKRLLAKTGKGNDFLGWMDLPEEIDEKLLQRIEATAAHHSEISDLLLVIGIGGSYLGARAVIEALKNNFDMLLPNDRRRKPLVIYVGQNLSGDYLSDLLGLLDRYDYSVNVISKSGTTTEPAVAFRILREHLEKKYGADQARKRIVATTDKERGALKQLSDEQGYPTYVVPDDVGGRYSVLTPVGLLPIAIAGFNIRELVKGAVDMRSQLIASDSVFNNPAAKYAAARNLLYRQGKKVEIMVNYQPGLYYFGEFWKQLYGESEGKEGKGIFPASVVNTTDLHSMGQYIQEGERILFETVLSVRNFDNPLTVPSDEQNLDQLNFLTGKHVDEINQTAQTATMLAHLDGGVPNITITIPKINEYYLGQLIYFFEFACALSGYLLDVNPFDQPGVEAYKVNMFALLGKPGYEKQTEALRERLK